KLIGAWRIALQRPVPHPIQRQVTHDAIEIAGGMADLFRCAAVLACLGKAQVSLLHHVLGARPAADDRLGIVDQRAAMGEIEIKRGLVVGQSRAPLERVAASTYLVQAGSRRAERRSPYRSV